MQSIVVHLFTQNRVAADKYSYLILNEILFVQMLSIEFDIIDF